MFVVALMLHGQHLNKHELLEEKILQMRNKKVVDTVLHETVGNKTTEELDHVKL